MPFLPLLLVVMQTEHSHLRISSLHRTGMFVLALHALLLRAVLALPLNSPLLPSYDCALFYVRSRSLN